MRCSAAPDVRDRGLAAGGRSSVSSDSFDLIERTVASGGAIEDLPELCLVKIRCRDRAFLGQDGCSRGCSISIEHLSGVAGPTRLSDLVSTLPARGRLPAPQR